MSNNKDRQYCVLDHANKQADRLRANPNLVRTRQAKRLSGKMAETQYAGANLASEPPGKSD